LTGSIDKSELPLGEPRRLRDKAHLIFVASQPCLICGRTPADAHHLRFAQPRALGRKVSDEFTVPLCRIHHRTAHSTGNEAAWWEDLNIDSIAIAQGLWEETRDKRRHHAVIAPTRVLDAEQQGEPIASVNDRLTQTPPSDAKSS
jgi:hypothetical protein